ncbi:MAG: hypothetical protein GWP09_02960 [Nitrospiraceae bacterium]|nr:hypothetical protein [Nitrospiraceae bacterium]
MSYVVSNGRTFKEFDSLSEAMKNPDANEETLYEKDAFGNLRRLTPGELSSVKEDIINNNSHKVDAPVKDLTKETSKVNSFSQNQVEHSDKEESQRVKVIKIIIYIILGGVILYLLLFVLYPLIFSSEASPNVIQI